MDEEDARVAGSKALECDGVDEGDVSETKQSNCARNKAILMDLT